MCCPCRRGLLVGLLVTQVVVGCIGPAAARPESVDSRPGRQSGVIEVFKEAHGEFGSRATSLAPIQIYGTYLHEADLNQEPGEFDLRQLTLDATVPVPVSRDSFYIVGALAGVRSYDFEGVSVADDDLHRYGIRLGGGHFVNDDLVIQGYWQPSIFSDLGRSLHSEDYRLWYGTGLAVYRSSRDWFWKVGFILTDAVDTTVLPLLGFTWHATPEWQVEVLFPRDATLVWRPSNTWTFSAGIRSESNEYHLHGPAALGKPEHDVHVQEFYLGLGAEMHHSESVSTFVRAGVPVGGYYDWSYDIGAPDYDGTLTPSPFVTVGLGWRF